VRTLLHKCCSGLDFASFELGNEHWDTEKKNAGNGLRSKGVWDLIGSRNHPGENGEFFPIRAGLDL